MLFDLKGSLLSLSLAATFAACLKVGFPERPHLLFSSLNGMPNRKKSWKQRLEMAPEWILSCACTFLLVAIANPHATIPSKEGEVALPPTEGSALYLVLDKSGSMAEEITVSLEGAPPMEMAKVELMKEMTARFIRKRPNDLIGLVSFARSAQLLSPLTLDHKHVLDLLGSLKTVQGIEQGGTAIGYAVFKTAQLIEATRHFASEASYKITDAAIILVTDGVQQPNPLDAENRWRAMALEEMANRIKKGGTHLYAINIDPKLAGDKLAPYRRELERAIEMTGGKLFIMHRPSDLTAIYGEIDQLQKSSVPAPSTATSLEVSYTHWPLAIALVLILAATITDTLWLRRFP